MVKHEGRDVVHARKSCNCLAAAEQTEEEKDEPLEDQPGETCGNLFKSR